MKIDASRWLGALYVTLIFILIHAHRSPTPVATEEHSKKKAHFDGPLEFIKFHLAIRTMEGKTGPDYEQNYQWKELEKATQRAEAYRMARTSSNVVEWKERGPANVPGRTRGVIVDPDDPSHRTWYAGSATGGIWKTIDGGTSWQWLTPTISNLATSAITMAESNRNVIYAGSGEGFGLLGGVNGTGIFKSITRGNSWTLLSSTTDFGAINRIIVHPADENHVLVAANTGIYRTLDGGLSWSKTFTGLVQDIKATPGNFSVQYAGQNGKGVLKSTDGGVNWSLSSDGIVSGGRVEIAVSPVKMDRIFASCVGSQSGTNSDLYVSDNGGITWTLIELKLSDKTVNYLGNQGWYDNTVACDPFDKDKVYVGGIGAFRVQIGSPTGTTVGSYSIQENGTTFLSLVPATGFSNSTFDVKSAANQIRVEVRFGAGVMQKAHRFLVPEGKTSGVPDAEYTYQDYVTVPFQVWDVTAKPPRQLMASFRDQDRNGEFNLNLQNITSTTATEQSREYLFIHNIDYSENASAAIGVTGGQVNQQMYNFWPVLRAGSLWTPTSLPTSNVRILYTTITKVQSTVLSMSDSYNDYDGKNNANLVHPDQHNIVVIKETSTNFRLLMANDGGLYLSKISDSPGVIQGDWTKVGNGYNTSQFYGADKKPGADEYIGGMQDNSTYYSPSGVIASASTSYLTNNVLAGDGFETVWHNLDGNRLIGGSQYNNFGRSLDGGITWTKATTGLANAGTADAHPFVSKLANSKQAPDILYTVNGSGVWKSADFGGTWILTPITEKWASSSWVDVEVSRANANIIWAGNGMSASQSLHVSTDGAKTFKSTTVVYPGRGITKLASHPVDEKTAYALFSQAKSPKILRTQDLGQTWEDISGFENGAASTRGFPDVAVFCLYIRTDNPDIIWAGTELGIVESLDNGLSWNLIEDFPKVSVWDMKGQDDQIVVATHGRGIWTAKVPVAQVVKKNPTILAAGTSPRGQFNLKVKLDESFDSTLVLLNNQRYHKLGQRNPGTYTIKINNVATGSLEVKLVAYSGSAPIYSTTVNATHLSLNSLQESYSNYFVNNFDLERSGMEVQNSGTSVNKTLQTPHPYLVNKEYSAILKQPIKIGSTNPSVHYSDVALVEPNDAVSIEATKDGLEWVALSTPYNASFNANWSTALSSNQPATESMFIHHSIDLRTKFSVGDTLLFRFLLRSNAQTTAWGWSLDNLFIQQTPTGVEESVPLLSMFPNPSSGKFQVVADLKVKSDVAIEIMDITGRKIQHHNFLNQPSGEFKKELDLDPITEGFYLVRITTATNKWVRKIKIER